LPSAWGTGTVDLAAPGTGIVNADGDPADRGNGRRYNFRTGTSMAAAHVSGIAALIASESPRADAIRIKSCILAGVDKVPALRGYVATGGRANAARALAACRR
jgi:subtilisin family serine protease